MSGPEIRREFDDAAPRYDLMVALNPGYHRHLRAAARALVSRVRSASLRMLDLGCGSGASTRALVAAADSRLEVLVGVDASAGMLARARTKAWPIGVTFRQARAEDLVDDETFDGVLAAYLFRNVAATDRDDVTSSVFRVLAPGGALVVQEYSVAQSRRAALVWTAVCWLVVIPLSVVTSRRTTLCRYLWRSVLAFDSTVEFADRLARAGFIDIRVETVAGWQRGILHTFTASTPS